MVKNITAEELYKRMEENSVYLIDVREDYEYRTEAISGSHLIPLHQLSLDKLKEFDKDIVIYCRSGGRSLKAAEKLLQVDQSLNIFNLEGGILAWMRMGYRVETDPIAESEGNACCAKNTCDNKTNEACKLMGFFKSGDRKFRLMLGSLILGGVIFGQMLSNIFYLLPIGIGLGLVMSAKMEQSKECSFRGWVFSMIDKLLGKK